MDCKIDSPNQGGTVWFSSDELIHASGSDLNQVGPVRFEIQFPFPALQTLVRVRQFRFGSGSDRTGPESVRTGPESGRTGIDSIRAPCAMGLLLFPMPSLSSPR